MQRSMSFTVFTAMILVAVFGFVMTGKTSPEIQENGYLIHATSLDDAKRLADEYNLELTGYSRYKIASYVSTQITDTFDLIAAGFAYNGTSIVQIPPWQSDEDPYLDSQYALDMTDTIDAWTIETGSAEVIVAIIDSGIDIGHPEFTGRISQLSYNVVTDTVGLEAVVDDTGHGTMVAGVIGAISNNSIGIAGIVQNVKLLVIKANIPGEGSFYDSSIIDAIYYATDNGASIINLSLGGYYENPLTAEAIRYAEANGVVVVGAAGNDGIDDPVYPASFPEAISVSAVDMDGYLADYSNHNEDVDITAPGSEIVTTAMNSGYASVSGTSFAAPIVSGILALKLSHDPDISLEKLKASLYATTTDKGVQGWDEQYGYGIVNAYHLLSEEFVEVSFETFGGSHVEPIYVEANTPFTTSEIPISPNQVFLGWFFDSLLTEPFREGVDIVSADTILYAKYTDLFHTVTYVTEGTNSGNVIYEHKAVISPPDSFLESSRFLGWYLDPGYVEIYDPEPLIGDLTLYARFEPIIYHEVTLHTLGIVYDSLSWESGVLFDPEPAVVEGYVFSGWYLDPEFLEGYEPQALTEDVSLYAKLEQIQLTVSLVVEGSDVTTIAVAYGDVLVLPEPEKPDGDFAGWYLDPEFSESYPGGAVYRDLTIYAKFVDSAFKVSYILFGEVYDEVYLNQGDIPELPEAQVEGYAFLGWYLDMECLNPYEASAMVEDLDLYAKMEMLHFTVIFYASDLVTPLSTQVVDYNQSAVTPPDPDKLDTPVVDYEFSYWDKDYANVTRDLEIYPVFTFAIDQEMIEYAPGIDTIYQKDEWIDAGIIIPDDSLTYQVSSLLDVNQCGRYPVKYEIYLKDEKVYELIRIVNVVEKPLAIEITLKAGITTVMKGDLYEDPGAYTNIGTIETSGSVDTATAGIYQIVYSVRINGFVYQKTRYVYVLDDDLSDTIVLYWWKEDEESAS